METNEPTPNAPILERLNRWADEQLAAVRAERAPEAAAWREWWAREGERETERFWEKFRATEPAYPDPGPVPDGMMRLWLWTAGGCGMAIGRTPQDAREAAARAALDCFTDNDGDDGLNGRDLWGQWQSGMTEGGAVALVGADKDMLLAVVDAATQSQGKIYERACELLASGAA